MAGTRRAAMGVALMLAAASWTTSCSAGDGEDGSALDTGPLDVTTSTAGGGAATTATTVPPPGAATTPGGPGQGASGPAPGAPGAPDTAPGVVGQPVQGAGYEITVHEVVFPAPAPDPAATPGPGHMLLSVDLELTNRTRGDRDATYLRLEVVDAGGAVYEASPVGDRPPTGWIPPNDPQRLVQIYEVPMLAAGLTLTLRPDLVSEIAVAVTLS